MATLLYRAGDSLGRVWPWLFVAMLLVTLATGCAASRIRVNPTTGEAELVIEGADAVPGVAEAIESVTGTPTEDVVGAVTDVVADTDIPGVVKDVEEGDWLSIALAAVGAGVAIFTGIKKRKKIREALVGKKDS